MAGQPDFNSEDYYKILGLPKTASEAEVNKAYKKLALKHHPDKNPDDKEQAEKRFKKISEAYSVLSDPEKKKTYDQFGKGGLNGGGGGPGGPHMNGAGFSAEDADKIFRMFFNGGDGGLGGFSMGGGMPGGGGSRMVFMSNNGGGPGMMGGGLGEGFGGFPESFMSMNLGNMMGGGRGMRPPGAGRRAGSSARPEPCAIPKGTPVVIHGLAKAPQHNGKIGEVQRFDSQRSRYDVAIDGGASSLALQPQNITQQQEIEIVGLTQKPELNGRRGQIVNYQDESGRYRVSLDNSAPLALSPGNCILREGTRVILRNLNNPKFSGEMAVITAVDREAGRYQVGCRSGEQIAVKFEKVTC